MHYEMYFWKNLVSYYLTVIGIIPGYGFTYLLLSYQSPIHFGLDFVNIYAKFTKKVEKL